MEQDDQQPRGDEEPHGEDVEGAMVPTRILLNMNEVARAAMIAARSISACRTVMGTPFAGTACHQGSAPVSLRKARIHHLCYEYYAKKEAGVDTEKCTVLLTAIDQGSLSGAAEALGYTPSASAGWWPRWRRSWGCPCSSAARAA